MANSSNRCVIVDDVRASRELLGSWLTEFGYACTLAADGEAARLAAESARPDLIITDIEMPKCNGLELLAAIRSHRRPEMREIPVIVVSSLNDERLIELVTQLGADCVISKPLDKFRVKSLLEALENGSNALPTLSHVEPLPYLAIGPPVSPKLRRMVDQVSRELL